MTYRLPMRHLLLACVLLLSSAFKANSSALPNYFGIGLQSAPGNISWMTSSGVPWTYRYQYVNPGWKTWNSPAGSFVKQYAQQGYIPVFTWYVIGGGTWGYPGAGLFGSSGMQSPSNMQQYYNDFILALQNAAASGVTPIIFHIEPDLWGFMQQVHGDNPAVIPVSVASSGVAALSGLPNNAAGFAQALITLRNAYAPKVLLAWHASIWGPNNGYDPTLSSPASYQTPQATGDRVANFYKALNANFDLIFHDPSDADFGLQSHRAAQFRQYGVVHRAALCQLSAYNRSRTRRPPLSFSITDEPLRPNARTNG